MGDKSGTSSHVSRLPYTLLMISVLPVSLELLVEIRQWLGKGFSGCDVLCNIIWNPELESSDVSLFFFPSLVFVSLCGIFSFFQSGYLKETGTVAASKSWAPIFSTFRTEDLV